VGGRWLDDDEFGGCEECESVWWDGDFDREEMKRQRLLYEAKSSRGRAMGMGGGRGLYVA